MTDEPQRFNHQFGMADHVNFKAGPGELTVAEGDRIASRVEATLRRHVEYLRHVSVHYHPNKAV